MANDETDKTLWRNILWRHFFYLAAFYRSLGRVYAELAQTLHILHNALS